MKTICGDEDSQTRTWAQLIGRKQSTSCVSDTCLMTAYLVPRTSILCLVVQVKYSIPALIWWELSYKVVICACLLSMAVNHNLCCIITDLVYIEPMVVWLLLELEGIKLTHNLLYTQSENKPCLRSKYKKWQIHPPAQFNYLIIYCYPCRLSVRNHVINAMHKYRSNKHPLVSTLSHSWLYICHSEGVNRHCTNHRYRHEMAPVNGRGVS